MLTAPYVAKNICATGEAEHSIKRRTNNQFPCALLHISSTILGYTPIL